MRRQDLAAIHWLEVTIRRAGQRAAVRYARYTQHEQPVDSMDANVFGVRLGKSEDPDEILDLQRAFRNLSEDEQKVLWFSVRSRAGRRRASHPTCIFRKHGSVSCAPGRFNISGICSVRRRGLNDSMA